MFLCWFIMFLHLISFFLDSRSLFVLYAYVSIESIDYFLFSSFKLKAILVISSLKTLCFSLLNLCFVFRISIFFYEFLVIFFKTMYANFIFLYKWLFLSWSWIASKHSSLFWNLSFRFMTHFFVLFTFLSSSLLSLKKLHVFALNATFVNLIHLSLIQPLFYFLN